MTTDVAEAPAVAATAAPAASPPVAAPAAQAPAAPAAQAPAAATPPAAPAAPAPAAATGAPEKYEAFAMPEGTQIDQALVDGITPTLKELNLTQAQAQKIMDAAPQLVQSTVQKTVTGVLNELGMVGRDTWADQVKNDKELGGEKHAENLAIANKAFAKFGGPALTEALKASGFGAHPEMVRAFYRIGKAISDDSFVPGGANTGPEATVDQRRYDASKMNP